MIASLSPSLLVSVVWTLLRRALFCAQLGVRPRGPGDRGRIDERRSVRRGGFSFSDCEVGVVVTAVALVGVSERAGLDR